MAGYGYGTSLIKPGRDRSTNIDWKIEGLEGRKIRPRDGSAYLQPATGIHPLEQGFVIEIEHAGKTITKRMQAEDWDEISFEATYPIATIRYIDNQLPIEIVMEAYSPFIPLDADNSGLPATILSFEIINNATQNIKVTLTSFLENQTAIYTATPGIHSRINTSVSSTGSQAVLLTVEGDDKISELSSVSDYGSMCLACLDKKAVMNADYIHISNATTSVAPNKTTAHRPVSEKLFASVAVSHVLKPSKSEKAVFVISWFFPNLSFKGMKDKGRYYSKPL